MSVNLELGYPRQEDCHEPESNLSFLVRLSGKTKRRRRGRKRGQEEGGEEEVIYVNKCEDKDIV